jgi:hypothetical protein
MKERQENVQETHAGDRTCSRDTVQEIREHEEETEPVKETRVGDQGT